jgi:hypothetical protein
MSLSGYQVLDNDHFAAIHWKLLDIHPGTQQGSRRHQKLLAASLVVPMSILLCRFYKVSGCVTTSERANNVDE